MAEFKLIIAGGRDFNDYDLLRDTVTALATTGDLKDFDVSIVSGMACGADALGAQFAHLNSVKLYRYPANWEMYGKRAGFMRNEAMGEFADGLLAFWDGESRGTQHMIKYMQRLNKPVFIIKY